jgi:hypothetical protein
MKLCVVFGVAVPAELFEVNRKARERKLLRLS